MNFCFCGIVMICSVLKEKQERKKKENVYNKQIKDFDLCQPRLSGDES